MGMSEHEVDEARIRHNMRELMRLAGLSRRALALRAGVSVSTLDDRLRYDHGRFSNPELTRIAEALGESLERLTGPELMLVAIPADSVGPAGIEPATKGAKLLVRALGNDENPKAA